MLFLVIFGDLNSLFSLPSVQPQASQHSTSEMLHMGVFPARTLGVLIRSFLSIFLQFPYSVRGFAPKRHVLGASWDSIAPPYRGLSMATSPSPHALLIARGSNLSTIWDVLVVLSTCRIIRLMLVRSNLWLSTGSANTYSHRSKFLQTFRNSGPSSDFLVTMHSRSHCSIISCGAAVARS